MHRNPADFIDKEFSRMMRKNHLPGLALTIVDGNDVIYQKAAGLADRENNIVATSKTVFKLYSVSKLFTAIEIFREVEEGLVDLDDPIGQYLPAFKIRSEFNRVEPITVKSLLAHRSGLPRNECVTVQEDQEVSGTLDKFENAVSECFMAYPVGTRYHYSNLGYDLLGRIIEENRETGYSRYMKSCLLDAMGMSNSTFNSADYGDDVVIANGYEYYKREHYRMDQADIKSVPSGNLYSTIEDLSVFLKVLTGNGLFKDPTTLDKMTADHYSRREDPETMGLGWKTTRILNDQLLIWHDGGPSDGMGALVAFLPGQKLAIGMAANSTSFSTDRSLSFAVELLNHIVKQKSNLKNDHPKKTEKILCKKDLLKKHEGTYVAWGLPMNVEAKNNKLKARISGIGLNLIPVENQEFKVTNWMDQLGLTKFFNLPVDFARIRIYFTKAFDGDSSVMVINLDNISFEICPRYPDQEGLDEKWADIPGTYQMAWRLPGNRTGQLTENHYTISMDQRVLTMSGIFGPLIPIDENHLRILSGPFAGEIMEYDSGSGRIFHQNAVFCPTR